MFRKCLSVFFTFVAILQCAGLAAAANKQPNILWIFVEDQSRHYGCYGEPLVRTPQIDRLAAEGAKFTSAAVTGPVCSVARSALITGMYQTTIGAHHHRSGRGTERIRLPEHIRLIPEYFKDAGYFTSLGSIANVTGTARKKGALGKSDYNFDWDPSIYDAPDWTGRKKGQPFFAQIMLSGGKARAQARKAKGIPHVKIEDVKLPPYYPRHPAILEDWAAYLDTFTLMDHQVGLILKRLREEGVLDETVIFFLTDHGVSHARGKQFCYDEGIMVPLLIRYPAAIKAGTVRDDLVAHIDVAATSLHFAGIPLPKHLEARTLFGQQYRQRRFVVSGRDRCDETVDRIRSVRTDRFKYIRNGMPKRPHLQPNVYKDAKETYFAIREWHVAGKLNDLQTKLLFAPERPVEELYDLQADPWELNNLAAAPDFQSELSNLRMTLDKWIQETGDRGQADESPRMYDSDMKLYVDTIRARRGEERAAKIESVIRLMKQWRAEGR